MKNNTCKGCSWGQVVCSSLKALGSCLPVALITCLAIVLTKGENHQERFLFLRLSLISLLAAPASSFPKPTDHHYF